MARVEGECDARSRCADTLTIDAHQHFWSVARGDYAWLDNAPGALRRDFLPGDLQPQHDATGIVGSVLVQAAPTLAETRFLIGLAARTSSPEEAGMKDFPYKKAKQSLSKFEKGEVDRLSRSLLELYHHGHQGLRDLDVALEEWVLTV